MNHKKLDHILPASAPPVDSGAFIQACKDEFYSALSRRAEEQARSMLDGQTCIVHDDGRVQVLGADGKWTERELVPGEHIYGLRSAGITRLEAGSGILADGRTAREVACDERWTAAQYQPAHCRRCGHDHGCMCPRGER